MVGPSVIGSIGATTTTSVVAVSSLRISAGVIGWFSLFLDFSCSSIDFMSGGSLL